MLESRLLVQARFSPLHELSIRGGGEVLVPMADSGLASTAMTTPDLVPTAFRMMVVGTVRRGSQGSAVFMRIKIWLLR